METEVLEGESLSKFVEKLGSDTVGLHLEGRLYRNVQNKQNICTVTARLGEFSGFGLGAKAAIDPDLGDDATVLLAVGRALEDLGLQVRTYIYDAIEMRLAHIREVDRMEKQYADSLVEIKNG
jgi:hypothetical protein